jgi:16S rRNA (guanine527-N7)-methyltransferase
MVLEISGPQKEQFATYLEHLYKTNMVMNLVSDASPGLVARRHILDSLTLLPAMAEYLGTDALGLQKTALTLVDIGSGAGFPALALAIALPNLKVTMVESIGKKCHFLSECVEKLALAERVQVINCRAEELGQESAFRQHFDLATARAVSSADIVLELTLPMLKNGGMVLLQKTKSQVAEECKRLDKCLPVLGAKLLSLSAAKSSELPEHVIIGVEKVKATPAQYPRSASQIKKRPLGN